MKAFEVSPLQKIRDLFVALLPNEEEFKSMAMTWKLDRLAYKVVAVLVRDSREVELETYLEDRYSNDAASIFACVNDLFKQYKEHCEKTASEN